MPYERSSVSPSNPSQANAERVRRQARGLLRDARSEQLSRAMPALRRLHAAGVFGELRLSALAAQRQEVRLKHCLRALAVEYGYPSWEALKPVADRLPAMLLDRDRLYGPASASLHPWFGSVAEAAAYADAHGGRVVAVGRHAVVVAAHSGGASG